MYQLKILSARTIQVMKVKDSVIYNHAKNLLFVKSNGNKIVVICNNEEQMDMVHDQFYGSGNLLTDIEIWDEGKVKKWIITYEVTDDKKPVLNE